MFNLKNLQDRPVGAISFALAAFTIALFLPVGRFEFVNYDDWHYVSKNPIVSQGLTPGGIQWALTTTYFSYWHPLTWMSHMLDCSVFGLNAGWHHYMSVAFHAINTVLVFLLWLHLTGATWQSALVAILFGIHPMHVESVAWISERKDLVSTFFWLLTMFAYSLYAERRTWRRYLVVAVLFALGLMSKPMVVTLPCVLLLMDFWPLNRLGQNFSWRTVAHLIIEKVPLFLLAAGSAAITIWGTKSAGNILDPQALPWSLRLASMPVAYARYLGKLFWPEGMTVFYPMPPSFPAWQIAGSTLLVLAISIWVGAQWRKRPYLLFGWLWFVITLLPTIKIIPVGFDSLADRYTYISAIGVFVMVAWGMADLVERMRVPTTAVKFAVALAILGCAVVTWSQLKVWQNSVTLWAHSVAVTKDNAVAQYNLGHALAERGRYRDALPYYHESLRLNPRHFVSHLNLGAALLALEDLPGATNAFAQAVRLKPADDMANNNMGLALTLLGRATEATNHFARALAVAPTRSDVHIHYGIALVQLRDFTNALGYYSEALRLDPRSWQAHFALGKLFAIVGKVELAANQLTKSLEIYPENPEGHVQLGIVLVQAGRKEQGFRHLEHALKLDPASPEPHLALALALARDRQSERAKSYFREALRIKPRSAEGLNDLAWVLATHPDAAFRNGAEAVAMAEQACEKTSRAIPLFLGTLAAAYAEAGQFEKAVQTAQEAADLARSMGQADLAARNEQLLTHYQSRNPWREPP